MNENEHDPTYEDPAGYYVALMDYPGFVWETLDATDIGEGTYLPLSETEIDYVTGRETAPNGDIFLSVMSLGVPRGDLGAHTSVQEKAFSDLLRYLREHRTDKALTIPSGLRYLEQGEKYWTLSPMKDY